MLLYIKTLFLMSFSFYSINFLLIQMSVVDKLLNIKGFSYILLSMIVFSVLNFIYKSQKISEIESVSNFSDKESTIRKIAEKMGSKTNKKVSVIFYSSHDINAFASSIKDENKIYLSKNLVMLMSIDQIESVMWHEMNHILDKDDQVISLADGVIKSVSFTVPLILSYLFDPNKYKKEIIQLRSFKILESIIKIILFIPVLNISFYSRKKELKADAFSAENSSPENLFLALKMIYENDYLHKLENKLDLLLEISKINKKNKFKIDLFSSHPSYKSRLMSLSKIKNIKVKSAA